jgi:hypothetical protein
MNARDRNRVDEFLAGFIDGYLDATASKSSPPAGSHKSASFTDAKAGIDI